MYYLAVIDEQLDPDKKDTGYLSECSQTMRNALGWSAYRSALLNGLEHLYAKAHIIDQQTSDPIRHCVSYIQSHYSAQLSLGAMAEMYFLSPNYFSALFKKKMGQGFVEYLTDVRLTKAAEKLRFSDDLIYKIAEDCGYLDARYFLPTDIEKPILIISISESWLKSQLPSCDYEGSSSMLVNTDGQIISHTNEDLRMHSIDGPMLDALKQKTAGFFKQPVSGTDCIVFFNTLENGWKISTVVPVASIMAGIMRDITPVFLTLSLVILILCLLLSLSVSHSLQRPLRQLLNAIEQMEHGDFNVHLPDTHDEFQQVMSGYNKMAQRIDVLMEENYQSRCHEREGEMLALRYQTNPHFLYNALNIIHMNAKRAGDAETAALILLLSEIMRYVIRDQRDVVSLQEEIDNVQKYFALINVGYENGIHLEVNVSSEILDCALPKLSIQPLVENAVQHGLSDRIGDGLVRITGLAEGNDMVLTVGDNGKGLKNGTATTSSSGKGAIGIDNVRRRMAFLFEGSELITGTSPLGGLQVTLKLPLRKANMENKYDKS